MRRPPSFLLFGLPAILLGQTASFHEDRLHGRRAFVLENDHMRVSTLPGGGFIGEIRFKSSDPKKSVNPLRVPHYPTIDPFTYDVAKHGDLYGTGIQRRLISGYMGHFLCFPHFAASSPAEFSQDYGQHGEAIAVEWKLNQAERQGNDASLRYSADLPMTRYRVDRTITLPADETVAYVEESVENMMPVDRPMQWVQHVTFGPPFLELNKTYADGSVERAVLRQGQGSPSEKSWPQFQDGSGNTVDLRVFSGHANTWIMDRSGPRVWFTMYNEDYPVLIGYILESAPNPWVFDWQENQRVTEKPWDGKVIARAICIGDSTVSGLRNAVQRGRDMGLPVYSWIEARQKRTQHYVFFLTEIPLGYKGVARLRIEDGHILLTERQTGKTIAIKSAREW